MAINRDPIVDEWMESRWIFDESIKNICYTDADGNEFLFLSKGEETVLTCAIVKSSTVRLLSYVTDQAGTKHPLTCIGRGAFCNAQALKHLIIPEGVLHIENSVFAHSGSLLSVVIPASVQSLGSAFWNCPTFEEKEGGRIYYAGSQEQWRALRYSYPMRGMMDYTPYDEVVQFISDGSNFEIPTLDYQTAYIDAYDKELSSVRVCELGGEIAVPEYYTDSDGAVQKITHVGRSSFAGNNKVEKVIIPAGIQRICQDAFYQCANLREVVILKGEDVLDIETGAFFACECLEKVYIGRPCQWGEYALDKTNAQKIETN